MVVAGFAVAVGSTLGGAGRAAAGGGGNLALLAVAVADEVDVVVVEVTVIVGAGGINSRGSADASGVEELLGCKPDSQFGLDCVVEERLRNGSSVCRSSGCLLIDFGGFALSAVRHCG